MTFHCTIPGPSEAKGSTKAFVVKGRAVITSTNKRLGAWNTHAIRCLQDAMLDRGIGGPILGPVGLEFVDYRKRPPSRPKRCLWPDRMPDLDKVERAICDVLEASGLLLNDAQVCVVNKSKEYASTDRIEMRVWTLESSE